LVCLRSWSRWVARRRGVDRSGARTGQASAPDRARRADDLSCARRGLRPARRIVHGEGSVLYQRTGSAAGNGARNPSAGRRDGRLADSGESRHRPGRAVRLHEPRARPRRHRGTLRRRAGPLDHRGSRVRAAGQRPPLAPDLESVGALEMGLHVPGSAAGQRCRRSLVAAVPARRHSLEAGLVRRSILVAAAAALVGGTVVGAQIRGVAADLSPVVERSAHAGETIRAAVRVSLPEGFHVQSNRPRDPSLIPTTLKIDSTPDVSVSEIVFPAPVDQKVLGYDQPLAVFERDFSIGVQFAVAPAAAAADRTLTGHLRYQACNETTCFPPKTVDVTWTLKIVAAGVPVPTDAESRAALGQIAFGHGERPAEM